MAGINGFLGLEDGDSTYINTIGQEIVYSAANQFFRLHTEDMMNTFSVLVQEETENYKERYKLPGGGYMQRRGQSSPAGAVKADGGWDVAYPIEDFGAALIRNDIRMAYMALPEFNRHLQTIVIQDINTIRFEMLRRIFNNTQTTFVDFDHGSLTIEPLADGTAGVLYPPVIGSAAEATENHYLESGYVATAISDTNNPYITFRDELEEHFGAPQGFGNIAVFIHSDEVPETEDLTDFTPVSDNMIVLGTNTDEPGSVPVVPGRVAGRSNGVWVVEWRWIPSGWAIGIDLDAPAPLKIRRDPAATGLGRGLQLVSESDQYPLTSSQYRNRYGVGTGNRLNGVAMEFGTGGTYTIPTAYQ